MEDIEKRQAELDTSLEEVKKSIEECETEEKLEELTVQADEIKKELGELEEQRSLITKKEERKKIIDSIQNGTAVIESKRKMEEFKVMEERVLDINSTEYRSAWVKTVLGQNLTDLEKRAFEHTTANTSAVMPRTMVNEIWDLVSKEHSIVADVKQYRSGGIIELVKHTAIAAGGAAVTAEGTATTDEQNTFVKVTLSGFDIPKLIRVSFGLLNMSVEDFETYLKEEIAKEIGGAIADKIVNGAGTTEPKGIIAAIAEGQAVAAAAANVTYAELVAAFARVRKAKDLTVYVDGSTFYNQLVGLVDTSKRPIFQPNINDGAMGTLLGAKVKIEDAVPTGGILIGKPLAYALNIVKDVEVDTDKDLPNRQYLFAGYSKVDGDLMDDKAFAYVAPYVAG